MVEVSRLISPEIMVEIEAEAIIGTERGRDESISASAETQRR
jgi:hypothetical protein